MTNRLSMRGIRFGLAVSALVGAPMVALAQEPDTCTPLRAPLTRDLFDALAARKPADVRLALVALAKTPAFAVPKDPVAGRRPLRTAYSLKFSDRQLERRAKDLFKTIERDAWWLTNDNATRKPRSRALREVGHAIRNLLALGRAFPTWQKPARALARRSGDALISVSQNISSAAVPMAPAAATQSGARFMTVPLVRALKSCRAVRTSLRRGWFTSQHMPEMHYRETALVGEAMLRLARDTGEKRFLTWAEQASAWLTIRPIAADFSANAAVAGFDAELFILTADKKYLERALDWAVQGVLPAFSNAAGHAAQTNNADPLAASFARRMTLDELGITTRALVHVATAIAAAPLGATDAAQVAAIYGATGRAYAVFQTRALAQRRLQNPAGLIEIAIDVERAQLAGAPLPTPDKDALRHALAHGADRLQRYIEMPMAAKGRLLEQLQRRGWSNVHRTPRPTGSGSGTSASGSQASAN